MSQRQHTKKWQFHLETIRARRWFTSNGCKFGKWRHVSQFHVRAKCVKCGRTHYVVVAPCGQMMIGTIEGMASCNKSRHWKKWLQHTNYVIRQMSRKEAA